MALQKQPVQINFSQGLDTKSDPFQVAPGKFLSLENSVFGVGGQLTKRNGFKQLVALPDSSSTYCTTFNGALTAISSNLRAFVGNEWVNKGSIIPLELNTLSLVRNNTNQSQCDSVTAPNRLICTVYTDNVPVGGVATASYKYVIADSVTGQNVIPPTVIPISPGTVTGSPRVFLLGTFFVIVFTTVVSASSNLDYIAISTSNPALVTTAAAIASGYTSATSLSWDGVVSGSNLYIAYNTTSGGQAIKVTYLNVSTVAAGGTPVTPASFSTYKATMMSMCVDESGSSPIIYASFYRSDTSVGYTLAVDSNLNTILSPTSIISSGTLSNITSVATGGVCYLYTEVANNYSYGSDPSHYINKLTCSQAGSVSSTVVAIRSVGLASKAFLINNSPYFLAAYQSSYQSSYFLISGSSVQATPIILAKLAATNGGGYLPVGLPYATVNGTSVQMSYLIKDSIQAVNKGTNLPAGTATAGVYAQTGVNLATFNLISDNLVTSQMGQNLHLTGGFMWDYDGVSPVESGFFIYPENVSCTWSDTGGAMASKPDGSTNTNAYFYQVTYEWADNQGNIFRSAPSIPVAVTTTNNVSTGSVTLKVPTLRLTYKTTNPIKICVYRWSVAQQSYYQTITNYLTVPTYNSLTTDSVTIVDTLADASILGNDLLYTTGGVVENISPPACNAMTLFDNRLWILDSEDRNLLWYSKQVLEQTPVEMSDLLTFYVAPTIASQGPTGPITALSALDEKLIIFKADAIYYVTGNGPGDTGTGSTYSPPTFITSAAGCTNQNSIVQTPQGLMFQSDKGIWLLARDLSSQYIGAAVQGFNNSIVQSAVSIPGTNQVRFTLNTGEMLMYDYYYQQWGTFTNVPCVSSTLYQDLHTFINSFGQVFQETPNTYLDGSDPVLMAFTTSWLHLAGLQGYQRAYFFTLLGTYSSPHALNIEVAYNYDSTPSQQTIIYPMNQNGTWGSDATWGASTPWGGQSPLEEWQVFFDQQLCESFQITIRENFVQIGNFTAGNGLTLSGLNVIVGVKKGYRPFAAQFQGG